MANLINDYWMGGEPRVLDALVACNDTVDAGYGKDVFSIQAAKLIGRRIGDERAHVHFVAGGTQANLLVPTAVLRPWEAIISAATGHINVHESGGIEACGHKIIPVPTVDGKLTPALIDAACKPLGDEHSVVPRLVYISNSTELGTVYSRTDLSDLRDACDRNSLFLYLDGARLGQALVTDAVSFEDFARYCDAFYIGGTKNGALYGEAIVLVNLQFQGRFRNLMKQHGTMLAKGKFIGAQFVALFEDDLYLSLARVAKDRANTLREGILDLGYLLHVETETNQIFPVFPVTVIEELKKLHEFYDWGEPEGAEGTVRLVTSWKTAPDDVESFLTDLRRIGQ